MSATLERLDIARREVELFSDVWFADRQDECKRTSIIVNKGLHVHEIVVYTDEIYRSWLSNGECTYSQAVDLQIFALMAAWLDISEQVYADVQALKGDGFDVENSERFGRLIRDVREALSPDINEPLRTHLKELIESVLEGFRQRKFGPRHVEWWSTSPAPTSLLRVLRYRNMEAAGIRGDELKEFADLEKYPGTLLAELREPVVIRSAREAAESL